MTKFLCKLGWHKWSEWAKYDEFVRPPSESITPGGIRVTFSGTAMNFYERDCSRCGEVREFVDYP
jgi:hypothetical protein